MRSKICTVAFLLLPILSNRVWGQSGSEKIQELRQQVQQLERQLQTLEATEKSDARVKRIGGARTRLRERSVAVRLYDLSDLFTVAPPYPARQASGLSVNPRLMFPPSTNTRQTGSGGGIGGGMGGGMFDTQDRLEIPENRPQILLQQSDGGVGDGPRASLDDLITAITTTISPQSWTEAGGESSIAKVGNALLISAEDDTHDQIRDLFDLFRKRWGTLRTISVRAEWLWLEDGQLARLLNRPAEDKPATTAPQAFGVVNPQAWAEHHQQLNAPKSELRPGYRAAITCYNGQTVNSVTGTESLAVTAIRAVTSTDEGETIKPFPAYEPTVTALQEGIALQVTPFSNQSGKFVVADIRSRITHTLNAGRPKPEAANARNARMITPRDVTSALDRPELSAQQLSTTLRIPADIPMLVGGMSFEQEPDARSSSLYLFLTVSVQELRDDRPEDQLPVAPKQDQESDGAKANPGETPANPGETPAKPDSAERRITTLLLPKEEPRGFLQRVILSTTLTPPVRIPKSSGSWTGNRLSNGLTNLH